MKRPVTLLRKISRPDLAWFPNFPEYPQQHLFQSSPPLRMRRRRRHSMYLDTTPSSDMMGGAWLPS